MKPTIKSIAEAAKVSRGTVDKVLNNRYGVSQKVREQVTKIAKEMGYEPNLAGKALAYQKNPLKIGVIILKKDDPLFKEVNKGVQEALEEWKDFGIVIETVAMQKVTVEEQIKCIKELEGKDIVALALSPLEDEAIKKELDRLNTKNIKIVTFNTDITGIEKLCFVGQNLIQSGRVAGELVGKLLPNGGEVLIITGPPQIKALRERIEGFKEIIEKEYTDFNIIEVLENINDNEESFLHTIKVLKKYPDLKAIYITGVGIGGVGKALNQLKRKDIKVICFDIRQEVIKLINSRVIDFTITQEPFMQGYLPIKILFDYFYKNQVPSSQQIYTKLQILTKENLSY